MNKNPSKEQIINQAFKFHSQGNISEAAKYYQYFINQGFKDHRVFSNYGVILKDLGKLKEAELYTRKAIEIKPDFADAHSNLGNILKGLGKLKEAEISTRKAIELNANFANAYSNLGSILRDLGKLKEAEIYTRKAIEIKPDYEIANLNLGMILKDLDKLQEAEIYTRKAIELNPERAEAHYNLGMILNDLGKLQDAEISYRKAIEIKPDFVEAKINLDFITKQQVPLWHIPMMNDDERNNAYLKAIKSAIKNNEYVLEIGTGSGLLSMMAIDAGAKKVITCEVSKPIAEAAKKIIKTNGHSNRIEVINKKSTELNIHTDIEKKADLIISEILSSEFVGEGVQRSLSDANQRLLKENGRMIPEAGEIKVALLESSPEIEKELFVQRVNGYDLSELNNIIGKKLNVQYLGRKTTISFLSEIKVPFSFDLYSKEIINRKEIILEIEVCKSGICLGLISWLKLKLYENIDFENKPSEICTSGWVNPIYKFNQPLKITKGQLIKIKANLLNDRVWYEFI